MSVAVNHAISFVTSPLSVSMALLVIGWTLGCVRHRRLGRGVALAGLLYLWTMSTGIVARWLGMELEGAFPPVRVEALPSADAIVLLGGGVGAGTNIVPYTELYFAADRVAHAARVWKAGKAPVIIPSGAGEREASLPLLSEWGVPASSIFVESAARNTEENAKFVSAYVHEHRTATDGGKPKILLVTSSWHMRRALLMFRNYAPEIDVVPCACDYETTIGSDQPFTLMMLLPDIGSLGRTSLMLKEYIGYWGYNLLRILRN